MPVPEPGPAQPYPDGGHLLHKGREDRDDDLDDDLDDQDVATVGGSELPKLSRNAGPIDVSGLLATDDRARMASGAEPNGWFAGPPSDPDRYQLLGPGLAGGEGDIWRARYRGELTSPLTVAVKRLRRPAHVGDDWPTLADLRRWEDVRALLLIMRIDHMVSVLDIFVGPPPHPQGLSQGSNAPVTPYVVMEWVPGPTLADEFGGVPATAQTLDDRLRHVEQVATALDSLHSRTVSAGNPILHRDVKPTNCILAPDRGVVVVDVGTMRRMDDGHDQSGRHTPAYTGPEVLADPMAAREPASDLYSLGALAWFCVVGENPPHARDPMSPERARIRAQAAARQAGVPDPAAFAAHLTLMMAHDPSSRPADARSWAARLRVLASVRRRTSKSLLAAAVLIPLVAVALILLPLIALRGDRAEGADSAPDVTREAMPSTSPDASSFPFPNVTGPGGRPSPPPNPDGQPGPPVPPDGGGPRPPPDGEWPEGAVITDVVAFGTPENGAKIGQCPRLAGTSDLPRGRTLLFAVENIDVGDRVRHVTLIDGWRRPAGLASWKIRMPVGRPPDPPGTRYRVEAIVVPLAALKQQAPAREIPSGSYVGASVFVSRDPGSNQLC